MPETGLSGLEGGARFNPSSLPLSKEWDSDRFVQAACPHAALGVHFQTRSEEGGGRGGQGRGAVQGWDEGELTRRRQGDRHKVALARRLRAQTTMSLASMAERLRMGSWSYVSNLL